MAALRFDCNCDNVSAMEDMGVSSEDILQYVFAVLPSREIPSLIRGLDRILHASREGAPTEDVEATVAETV